MRAIHASILAATALALAGCSSVASGSGGDATSGDRIADGSTFSMQPGQSVTLADDGVLRYERLVNDSRCMPDVQCVWAGDAELAFAWRSRSGATDTSTRVRSPSARVLSPLPVCRLNCSVARGTAPEAQLRIDP